MFEWVCVRSVNDCKWHQLLPPLPVPACMQKWEDLELIYAGQRMADGKQLADYPVPPVSASAAAATCRQAHASIRVMGCGSPRLPRLPPNWLPAHHLTNPPASLLRRAASA